MTNVESLHTLPEVLSQCISTTVSERTAIESIYSLREASSHGDRASYEPADIRTYIDSVVSFAESRTI